MADCLDGKEEGGDGERDGLDESLGEEIRSAPVAMGVKDCRVEVGVLVDDRSGKLAEVGGEIGVAGLAGNAGAVVGAGDEGGGGGVHEVG